MSVGYKLTPRAQAGFQDIIDYVEREFGSRAAEEVLDRIAVAFELLAENPHIGHVRRDITDNAAIRFWSVGPTLLAYRRGAGVIEILFVERGERDWERLFRE